MQDVSYFSIIIICLITSLYNNVARQNFLWIYFLAVLLFEILHLNNVINTRMYSYSAIFYTLFFLNIYLNQYSAVTFIRIILNIIVVSLALFFYAIDSNSYPISIGLLMNFTYIFLGIIWLYVQFINIEYTPIIKRQFFWITISILIWSIFFLFRLVPMYLFQNNDKTFLMTIDEIFKVMTIVSYIIFFRGLICKI